MIRSRRRRAGPRRRRVPAWRRRATPAAIAAVIKARLDAAEHTEIANENVVGEVVDQICPRRALGLRELVHLIDQNPDAHALQRLPGAVEDDEGTSAIRPIWARRFDAAQEQKDHGGEQGDEEHHPDVNNHPGCHLVLQLRV